MNGETVPYAARDLAHQGYVLNETDPKEWIPNQSEARNVVADAMERTAFGLPAVISWYPLEFSRETINERTIEVFRRKIWKGVRKIVDGFSLDDEKHWVAVRHVEGNCFGVIIVRLNKPVPVWLLS